MLERKELEQLGDGTIKVVGAPNVIGNSVEMEE